jgi:fatty-acyl-CoA synthase
MNTHPARRSHWNAQLDRHAFELPDRPALRFQGRTTTWAGLRDRVDALAGALARRGVSFGDRVAVLMTNRPEFLETVLAANRLGASAVPINFRLTAPELVYLLDDSGAEVLVVDEDTARLAQEATAQLGRPVRAVAVGASAWDDAEAYEAVLAERGDPVQLVDVPEDTPALIMYTSGTTGRPKGAVLSHRNLQAQAVTIIRAWRLCADGDVNLVASPMFHIGAFGSIVAMILVGGTLVIEPSGAFDPAELLEVLERERVTCVFLVPAQWQALCAEPSAAQRDLSALRMMCWGAAPASETLLRRMAEVFPDALNVAVFGQTEMSPVTCALEGEDALRKIGSVGRSVASVAMRVVDAQLNDVPQGEIGEIVYQGPTVMQGYWRNPEATEQAFAGGWFHSGDLVRVDDEGFVYVVDRVKDMIISGGENIYCAEVENALAAHPDIVEVGVIGRPHPKWGETPVAVAALRDGATLDIEALRTWATGSLARYKLPTVLEIVPALPRNAAGKVAKEALRQRYARPEGG